MRGAVQFSVALRTSVALLAGFLTACTTTVTVAVDQAEDFAGYDTWDWLPETNPTAETDGWLPPSLYALVARNVERILPEHGFARSRQRADFFVRTELSIRRRREISQEAFAPHLVDSYNSSASYWVEGSNRVERLWHDLSLVLHISDAHGRTTWIGAAEQSVEAGAQLPLDAAVEALITRFAAELPGQSHTGRGSSGLAAAAR